ncbi:MAG: hypothetical protein LUQ37_05170 [Methanoregulaceae archaeon]|jgi:hypothetical protein|nr:hypothetical protein [Methanoregulaceae archaeon]
MGGAIHTKPLLTISIVLAALVLVAVFPGAAAGEATGSILKVQVTGPGGTHLVLDGQESGGITVHPGDKLAITGMAQKDGRGALTFTLFNATSEPWQTLRSLLFHEQTRKEVRVIHQRFIADETMVGSPSLLYFRVSSGSGAELDWAKITITVTEDERPAREHKTPPERPEPDTNRLKENGGFGKNWSTSQKNMEIRNTSNRFHATRA